MDDTFWNGTISEQEVVIPNSHIECIKKLIDRGIMNSISSKNDYIVVKNKLEEAGVFDFFVFPKINWDSKGKQIKEIIEQCNLRPINVLFIDDNVHNLEEAKYFCPELNVEEPKFIETLLQSPYLIGNDDLEHERLKQFKVLERKNQERKKYDTDERFLYESEICVNIKGDCLQHTDRILDLVNRSNQLNYTKVRLTRNELIHLLNDNDVYTYYVTVQDKYGDYGIVGFGAIRNNIAEHFLFSCRTIGLGVEQYVYAMMEFPQLHIQGDVITTLNTCGKPDWINQETKIKKVKKSSEGKKKILVRGGCDLSQLMSYLGNSKIDCEFNHLSFHRDHTVFAVGANTVANATLQKIINEVPFLYENSFQTAIFSEEYDVIVMSVLMDYTQAVYSYKGNNMVKVAYGQFTAPLSLENTGKYTRDELKWFFEHFCYEGRITAEQFEHNLNYIRNHIPNHTKLILINGCEIAHENENEPNRYLTHIEMNKVVDKFINSSDNSYLLDMRNIITGREDLTDNLRHYKRHIYYEMAKELTKLINELGKSSVKASKFTKRNLVRLIRKFIAKIRR